MCIRNSCLCAHCSVDGGVLIESGRHTPALRMDKDANASMRQAVTHMSTTAPSPEVAYI